MRKFILVIIGILFLAGSSYLAYYLVNKPKEDKTNSKNIYKPVAVDKVINTNIPVTVKTNGVAEAVRKFELFSEVEGVFEYSSKDYRTGQSYKKGQILLKLNDEEFLANVVSAKSDFFNLLVSIMPDIKIDYPNEFESWQKYLDDFDVQKSLTSLPEPSQQLKYFITGRGLLSAYFNIKNLETRLNKFVIRAPFDGVLTEAAINPGTLIRPGQRLGEFIDPTAYEVQIALQKAMIPFVNENDTVVLKSLEGLFESKGKISRINSQIDQQTQTIQVFVKTKDANVKEGMYLQVEVEGQTIENAFALNRSLLNNTNEVFVVNDTVLAYKKVNPVYYYEQKAIVKGLNDGDVIMTSNLSSAYPGMLVKAE
jgi:multidrug efflux pump subunit AcrA (membrane-fusion protein)